jgi:hypothetical protein
MPVTEKLMAAGSWSLTLDPATPKFIRDTLDFFGHFYVFDAPMRNGLGDAAMISASSWAGIGRRRPSLYECDGTNMIAWLGDENGKGAIYEIPIAGTNQTFSFYINNLINNASGAIHLGSIAAGGPTKSLSYQWVTPRAAIDHVCSVFGGEYRVNPDCTIDAGSATTLFATATTPDVIAMRRSSGRDTSIFGIPVTDLKVEVDAEDYVTRELVQDSAGGWHAAAGTATPYKDVHGNAVAITEAFVSSLTPAAHAAALAASRVNAEEVLHQEISLSTDDYAVTRHIAVGDWIWLYDPDSSLVDLNNQVRYRGSNIFPIKIRVLSITWPIERGMGVWYRDANGNWTDITNYIVWETPGVTLEIGAQSRPLTIASWKTI